MKLLLLILALLVIAPAGAQTPEVEYDGWRTDADQFIEVEYEPFSADLGFTSSFTLSVAEANSPRWLPYCSIAASRR